MITFVSEIAQKNRFFFLRFQKKACMKNNDDLQTDKMNDGKPTDKKKLRRSVAVVEYLERRNWNIQNG